MSRFLRPFKSLQIGDLRVQGLVQQPLKAAAPTSKTEVNVSNWTIKNENSVLLQEALEPHYIRYVVAKN